MNRITNRTTIYVFLLLLFGSWVLEFGLGWLVVHWFYGTAWYAWSIPNAKSLAATIVGFGHFSFTANNGTVRTVDFHWTTGGVLLFFFGIYVALHVLNATWWGLLGPFFKRRRLGVRPPVDEERAKFEAAFATVARNSIEPLQRPRRWLIAEGMGVDMRWIGYALVIDREFFNRNYRYLVPLLAHQLAHVNSEDRLAHRLYEMLPRTDALLLIVGGYPVAIGHVLLYPLWMWYWKERLYAADAFAVELGQGHALARALREVYLPVDTATRGGRWLKPEPYVAQRIDRIQRLLAQTTPGAQRII